jgi:hypothetical protein
MTTAALGTWDAEIASPIGKQSVVFEFTVDAAERLSGSATDKYGVVEMHDVSVDGPHLTWTQHVTRPLRLILRFDVEVDDDVMHGKATAGVLPASRVLANRRNIANLRE